MSLCHGKSAAEATQCPVQAARAGCYVSSSCPICLENFGPHSTHSTRSTHDPAASDPAPPSGSGADGQLPEEESPGPAGSGAPCSAGARSDVEEPLLSQHNVPCITVDTGTPPATAAAELSTSLRRLHATVTGAEHDAAAGDVDESGSVLQWEKAGGAAATKGSAADCGGGGGVAVAGAAAGASAADDGGAGDTREPFMLPCGHIFCEACITEWLQGHADCPSAPL